MIQFGGYVIEFFLEFFFSWATDELEFTRFFDPRPPPCPGVLAQATIAGATFALSTVAKATFTMVNHQFDPGKLVKCPSVLATLPIMLTILYISSGCHNLPHCVTLCRIVSITALPINSC